MQTARTLDRNAFTVRLRQCSNKGCRTTFVTEEVPGDPRVYHRLRAEDAARQRKAARRRGKQAMSAAHAA